jgi:predicted nucleic acid-binding protein
MRQVFWDTNTLLDLIDSERDGHKVANDLLAVCRRSQCVCLCSWHSLSIIEYVGGKKFGTQQIWDFLQTLIAEFVIPKTGSDEAKLGFRFLDGDFEDAMQIAAAVAGRADLLVTDSKSGFGKSPVKVVSPQVACRLL